MYFESRLNNVKDLTNVTIEEQAKSIKQLFIGDAIKIGNVLWVNDENPSGTGSKEAAILYQFFDKIVQFESVTFGWCSEFKIEGFIKEYSNTEILIKNYNIDSLSETKFNDATALSWFDCGCCGAGFQSTISVQCKFDQDAGYGFCEDCE